MTVIGKSFFTESQGWWLDLRWGWGCRCCGVDCPDERMVLLRCFISARTKLYLTFVNTKFITAK